MSEETTPELAQPRKGRKPPRRQKGDRGRRRTAGEVMDLATAASCFYGDEGEKKLRADVARRCVPFHQERPGARIFFLRSELTEFFAKIPGCGIREALENMRRRDVEEANGVGEAAAYE